MGSREPGTRVAQALEQPVAVLLSSQFGGRTHIPSFVLVIGADDLGGSARHPLPEGRTVVGRASKCDVVIIDDSISREHAVFIVSGNRIELTDLASRNNTYRNGELIHHVQVACGDRLRFGRVPGVIELLDKEPSASWMTKPFAIRRSDGTWPGAEEPPAVETARLIRLLGDIARTLVAALALPEILDHVFDLLFAHVRAERACLLMPDGMTRELSVRMVRRHDGRPTEQPVISKTVVGLTVSQQVAVVTSDVCVDPRFDDSPSIYADEIRSLMCGPLYVAGELIGVLYIDNTVANQFSEADLELFTALANYAAVAIARARLADQLIEERRRRDWLQRYHSPAIVDRMLRRPTDEAVLEMQELDVSVLFADMVGFTSMSESLPPVQVAAFLNRFYSRMVEIIFEEEGTLDKFLGDAILAIFGAPVEHADHAERAVRTAQAMKRAVAQLNQDARFPQFHVRYAINSGIAIAGDVGSARRREYTVLGDVVNTASRLERWAEPDQLIISRATYDRIGPLVTATSLGEIVVRGRTGKVEILSIEA